MSDKYDELRGKLDKLLGKGNGRPVTETVMEPVPRVSTGSLLVDHALGGGFTMGRIHEVYGAEGSGKTTLALQTLGNIQQHFGDVGVIDAEFNHDPEWAKALGVDLSRNWVCQPDYGEQALEALEYYVEAGLKGVMVDSVAALVPKAEYEGEVGEAHVGRQARMMSQELKRIVGKIHRAGACVIFINQLREKIGVQFGCVHGETLVNFVDGRSLPIRQVVEQKLTGEVWSWNEASLQFEARPIIDWHYNGKVACAEDYLHIQTDAVNPAGGGVYGLTVTPDHEVMTDRGWVAAKTLQVGDRLMSRYLRTVSGTFADFLSGVLVGDSHLSVRSRNTAALLLQDNNDPEYTAWKRSMLEPFMSFTEASYSAHGKVLKKVKSAYTPELAKIKQELGDRDPLYLMTRFSWLGFAVWLMDDGTYTSKNNYSLAVGRVCKNPESAQHLVAVFKQLGLDCFATKKSVCFTVAASRIIAEHIAPFVPSCMARKLPEDLRGVFVPYTLTADAPVWEPTWVTVNTVRLASLRQMRDKGKYDLSIEHTKNYMVGGKSGGVVIHNSPESTPGGKALKFYSSCRLDVRRIETIKEKDEAVANRLKVSVKKNRGGPQYRVANPILTFGVGLDPIAELFEELPKIGLIQKSGAFYTIGDTKLQGRSKVLAFLREHPELFQSWIPTIQHFLATGEVLPETA